MINVVCWKWKPASRYRTKFTARHVNTLRNMVARHLKLPHRFSCITDDPTGINKDIRIIPLWTDFRSIQNPLKGGPGCYPRLKAFSEEAKEVIGDRIFSLDLDCVITDDITPLVDRPEDFVCWGDTARNTHYNGGMWLLRAGTRTKVYQTFDPKKSPQITKGKGIVGSDQAWISYVLRGKDPKWTTADGVYSFRNHFQKKNTIGLPKNARVVMFHGQFNPWDEKIQTQYPWVRAHYKGVE